MKTWGFIAQGKVGHALGQLHAHIQGVERNLKQDSDECLDARTAEATRIAYEAAGSEVHGMRAELKHTAGQMREAAAEDVQTIASQAQIHVAQVEHQAKVHVAEATAQVHGSLQTENEGL